MQLAIEMYSRWHGDNCIIERERLDNIKINRKLKEFVDMLRKNIP